MAHGVEGPDFWTQRSQLLHSIAEALKIKNGQGKYLLRRWLATKLPKTEPYSKKEDLRFP